MYTTQMELNKIYAGVDDDSVTKRFQEMFLLMSYDYEQQSGIKDNLNNSTLLVT